MADSNATAHGAEKSPATKRAKPSASATKRTPSKPRTAARPASATGRKASTSKSSTALPKWLTLGASVTGAVVAVGATLFATRKEWLPRAKQLGEWVENSVHEQLENVATLRSKSRSGDHEDLNGTAAHFETSGADAGFKTGASAH